ncbi:MAG: hypothetical protein AB7I50_24850 [Vicinamibacterales bacterium]
MRNQRDRRLRWDKCTPASRYRNLLTGETVDVRTREGETFVLVADAFATYPVAWLYGASD